MLGLRSAAAAAAAATTTCSIPSLAGTLPLLHLKPCWDTAPHYQQPAAQMSPELCCRVAAVSWQLLSCSKRMAFVCFSTVIRVAHGSKQTFVLLFMNRVGPSLYTHPRYFVLRSIINLNSPPFIRFFVQSCASFFFFEQLTIRGVHPPKILAQLPLPIIQSVCFFSRV